MSGVLGMERWLLQEIVRKSGNPPIRFTLWNGEHLMPAEGEAAPGITFRDRGILLKFLYDPEFYFCAGYESGRIQVNGDLVDLLERIFQSMAQPRPAERQPLLRKLRISHFARKFAAFRRKNHPENSRRNIHKHYDIGNDFYKLWLDSNLVYTCAYFPSPHEHLESAQIAKMDLVCRKLGLRAGDTVVEAGCGWGALALYMARHYDVTVKAFNISREQIRYARRRAQEEGLQGQVEFIEDDYRNISGRFDVFVSVGMLEHVGLENYAGLAQVIGRSLTEQGRGLLHFIGRNREMPLSPWIRKRIFPGAYPPSIRQALKIFEVQNFSVLDLENMRLHYALTLQHWLERFENSADIVHRMFGEDFVRAWRLYLASSAAAFRTGWLQLFQATFTRAANNDIPWSRAHLYLDENVKPAETRPGRQSAHAEM